MIGEEMEGCLIVEVWHREGLSSSREKNRKEMTDRSEGYLSEVVGDLLMLGMGHIICYEEQGREERRKVY